MHHICKPAIIFLHASGRRWLELTDGQGAEALLPYLLEAAPRVGAEPAPVAAALESVLRDKNQAIAALDKVGAQWLQGKHDTLGIGRPFYACCWPWMRAAPKHCDTSLEGQRENCHALSSALMSRCAPL
jgi:hypothetical protein